MGFTGSTKPTDAQSKDTDKKGALGSPMCLLDLVPPGEAKTGKLPQADESGDVGKIAHIETKGDSVTYKSKASDQGLDVLTNNQTKEIKITDKAKQNKLNWNWETHAGTAYNDRNQEIFNFKGKEKLATTFIERDPASSTPDTQVTQNAQNRLESLADFKSLKTKSLGTNDNSLRKIAVNADGNFTISSNNLSIFTDSSSGQIFLKAENGVNLMYKDNKFFQLPANSKFGDALEATEINTGSGKNIVLRAGDGTTSTISLGREGEVNVDGITINAKSGQLTMASKAGLVTVQSGGGQSRVNNAGISDLRLMKDGNLYNEGSTKLIFTRYFPDGTVISDPAHSTHYKINRGIIDIHDGAYRTRIDAPNRQFSAWDPSGRRLGFNGSGLLAINGIPIFSSSEEKEREEEESGKKSPDKANNNSQLAADALASVNLAALIQASHNPAELSKVLGILQFNATRLQTAALEATPLNLPLVTLYKASLSQISAAESHLHKSA